MAQSAVQTAISTTPPTPTPSLPSIVEQAMHAGFRAPRHTVPIAAVQHLMEGIIAFDIIDPYIAQRSQAGQFLNLYSHNDMMLMPRPFGISEVHDDIVSLIFAVVGEGTEEFATMRAGDTIDVLGPLGKPYAIQQPAHYVLVGGGLGAPPLIHTAQHLAHNAQSTTTALLGYRTEHFADHVMQRYAHTTVSIDNHSGNVIDLLNQTIAPTIQEYTTAQGASVPCDDRGLLYHILTCGPNGMMKAVAHWAAEHHMPCQVSMEQRMGCGYGTCVVCTVDTIHGRLKVCNDGPVFTREDLGWN